MNPTDQNNSNFSYPSVGGVPNGTANNLPNDQIPQNDTVTQVVGSLTPQFGTIPSTNLNPSFTKPTNLDEQLNSMKSVLDVDPSAKVKNPNTPPVVGDKLVDNKPDSVNTVANIKAPAIDNKVEQESTKVSPLQKLAKKLSNLGGGLVEDSSAVKSANVLDPKVPDLQNKEKAVEVNKPVETGDIKVSTDDKPQNLEPIKNIQSSLDNKNNLQKNEPVKVLPKNDVLNINTEAVISNPIPVDNKPSSDIMFDPASLKTGDVRTESPQVVNQGDFNNLTTEKTPTSVQSHLVTNDSSNNISTSNGLKSNVNIPVMNNLTQTNSVATSPILSNLTHNQPNLNNLPKTETPAQNPILSSVAVDSMIKPENKIMDIKSETSVEDIMNGSVNNPTLPEIEIIQEDVNTGAVNSSPKEDLLGSSVEELAKETPAVKSSSSRYPYTINQLLDYVVERDASDLHITVGYPAMVRIDGDLVPVCEELVTDQNAVDLILPVLPEQKKELLDVNREVDLAYAHKKDARFRINAYYQQQTLAGAFRLIPNRIRSVDELGLPQIYHQITKLKQGLILVTGPTGSGKSTTLAAMIQEINESRPDHIITIEDPVEYVYSKAMAMVDQRELHEDTHSWEIALKSALRQDPDVLLVGEMRDFETISSAITLAETGHLVFATLHTNSAAQTIDRVIDVFPEHQQAQVRSQISNTIEAVIAQRLIPITSGGRRAVSEIMLATPAIRNLIREAKTHQIDNVIRTSADIGMISMEHSLVKMVRENIITLERAQEYAVHPEEVVRLLRS